MEPTTMQDWLRTNSKSAKILEALKGGQLTRAQLLKVTGGSPNGLTNCLQRLVAEERVVRVYTGVYALKA